jgi:hypothetical protein
MKFLKEWSLLFVIFFSSFLKASADQAAEVTPQEEVTVDQILAKVAELKRLYTIIKERKLQLLDFYTRFVNPSDPLNVTFNMDDLLKKPDLTSYLNDAKDFYLTKEARRKEEEALRLKEEAEFEGAVMLQTGE